MGTPNIVPTGFNGNSLDFNRVKIDREGSVRGYAGTTQIANSSTANTIVGMVPFRAGARFGAAPFLHCADLDTGSTVTMDFGFVYDSTAFADSTAAFLAGATAPQTGGVLNPNLPALTTWQAAGDGWLTVTIKTATTTAAGAITYTLPLMYDNL